MITKKQIEELSRFYRIDEFTIMREYLQLVFLSHLYQKRRAKNIHFKGGTAIRLLFGSSRFSEDLDFSTTYKKNQLNQIVKETEKSIQKEISQVKIIPLYSAKEGERFRIKYQAENLKYPLIVRLDFHQVKKIRKTEVSPLVTKFPIIIFPLVSHLRKEEILLEKINALLTRGKGRDLFDVWFLLEKGVAASPKINKTKLLNKIKNFSSAKLKKDLSKFLPRSQREMLDRLKERLENYLYP